MVCVCVCVGGGGSIEFNMAVQWCQDGVCGVCVCVFDPKVFCKKHYRRFDVGQFANVCCKVKLLKRYIIVGHFEKNRSLDDRSGGWVDGVEWFGEGQGWGWGWGLGRGGERGRGE